MKLSYVKDTKEISQKNCHKASRFSYLASIFKVKQKFPIRTKCLCYFYFDIEGMCTKLAYQTLSICSLLVLFSQLSFAEFYYFVRDAQRVSGLILMECFLLYLFTQTFVQKMDRAKCFVFIYIITELNIIFWFAIPLRLKLRR